MGIFSMFDRALGGGGAGERIAASVRSAIRMLDAEAGATNAASDEPLVERLASLPHDEFARYVIRNGGSTKQQKIIRQAMAIRAQGSSHSAMSAKQGGPIVHLGGATGLFATRNHSAAMYLGEPVVLSPYDCFENVAIVGAPGSGKSRGILQPLVYDWLKYPNSGMIAFGVKRSWVGTLRDIAKHFRTNAQIHVIGPEDLPMSLLLGLSPDGVGYFARSAFDLHARGQGHHQFFTDSAANAITGSAMLLEGLCFGSGMFVARLPSPNGEGDIEQTFTYSIPSIYELVYLDDKAWNAFEAQARERAMQLADAGRTDLAEQIGDGLRTFSRELLTQAPDTKNGIKGQIATVFSPFVINRKLRSTFCGSERFDFTCLDRGEVLLVDVDVQEFPVAAELAYLLVFQHLAGAAQRREGTGISNPVLLLLDEYTRIAEIRQADLFQTARGAAIACVIAYQSQARMNHVLGGAIGGDAVLGTFRNIIAFSADEAMLKILQTLTGKSEVLRENRTRQRGRSLQQANFMPGTSPSGPSVNWSESTAQNIVERSVVDAQIFRSLRRRFRDDRGAPLPIEQQFAEAVAVLSINQRNKDDVIAVQPWDPPKE